MRQEPGAKSNRPCRAKFPFQLKPDLRPDALPVGFIALQPDAQPSALGLVQEQFWLGPVLADDEVGSAVMVEVRSGGTPPFTEHSQSAFTDARGSKRSVAPSGQQQTEPGVLPGLLAVDGEFILAQHDVLHAVVVEICHHRRKGSRELGPKGEWPCFEASVCPEEHHALQCGDLGAIDVGQARGLGQSLHCHLGVVIVIAQMTGEPGHCTIERREIPPREELSVFPHGLDDLSPPVFVQVSVKRNERFLCRGLVTGIEAAVGNDEIHAPIPVEIARVDSPPKTGELG
ncbi:uncharacterized protein METZ01_LOCUS193191, partial [marine metagenome]